MCQKVEGLRASSSSPRGLCFGAFTFACRFTTAAAETKHAPLHRLLHLLLHGFLLLGQLVLLKLKHSLTLQLHRMESKWEVGAPSADIGREVVG